MQYSLIAVDLGGSEIRTKVSRGDDEIKTYDNMIKHVLSQPKLGLVENKEDEFRIIACPKTSLVNIESFYAKGDSMLSYSGCDLIPNNQQLKTNQDVTYLNLIYSVAREALKAEGVYKPLLGVCVPAVEKYQGAGDVFINDLVGNYEIEFPQLDKIVKFEINKEAIHLTGEGIIAFLHQMNQDPDWAKKLSRKTILLIDVGFRSTELTLIVNMRPAFYTAVSPAKGGINVEGEVFRILTSKNITDPDVREGVKTGYLMRNGQKIAVGSAVQAGKRILANSLREDIISMVSATKEVRNIGNIDGIFATGRAFDEQGKEEEDTGSLLDYIKESINCDVQTCKSTSLGKANILGTFMYLENKILPSLGEV